MSKEMLISTKAKLVAMKVLQSNMKNLKSLYTDYFPHIRSIFTATQI